MKNAIIIGASSGIGKALSQILASKGYGVGLAARRLSLLMELQKELGNNTKVKPFDISNPQLAIDNLMDFIKEMGDVELIINCAGIGHINKNLEWNLESDTIAVNVSGFTAITTAALNILLKKVTDILLIFLQLLH
jgi:short-subunit dehydrogenase